MTQSHPHLLAAALLSSTLLTVGCTGTSTDTRSDMAKADGANVQAELAERDQRIASLQDEVANRNSRINQLEGQLKSDMNGLPATSLGAKDALFPPNAKAGQCYARVLYPEKYRDVSERVLAKEASERIEIIPARFETVTERVVAKEASSRFEVVPATYRTVKERVEVRPAGQRIVEVPATFREVSERVLVTPATTEWKKGPAASYGNKALSESMDSTGELMCLVEVPAVYKTVTRQVVATPASTRTEQVPAEYRTVERTVLATPASSREVQIPAQYATVEVTRLVTEAKERKTEIPAEYRNVSRRELVTAASMDWQRVMCEVNMNPATIRELQTALKEKGFNPGDIDGILGSDTIAAVNRFARGKGIPQGANYVPMDVVKSLGVNI